jgi:hypothetical protein
MTNLLHRSIRNAALLLGIALSAAHVASGQAVATGGRGAELSPFAFATVVGPDYGQPHDLGYTLGIDYTHFIRFILQPSVEVRFTRASGQQIDENSFGGGLKFHTNFGRVRPYAAVLIGQGNLTFHHAGVDAKIDKSTAIWYGGGAEYEVNSQWRIRGEFMQQYWNLDPGSLTPSIFSVGFAYRIPFRNGRGR